MAPIPLIIGGKDIITDNLFTKIGPLDNREIWKVSSASEADAIAAADNAHNAFAAWSATKPSHRRDVFLRAADIMAARKSELGEYMRLEIGANLGYQDFIIGLAIEGLKDTAGRIAGVCTGTAPVSDHENMRAMVLKRPYGVVLGIAPWNAPFHLGLRSVTYALAVGNTAVLKGSELSPKCYWAIADVFREAGLPAGCLNLLFHQPLDAASITNALIAHPAIKKINFTGSTKVGSIISEQAGKHLKPVLMELGGKANAIVLADADMDKAATHCAVGAFINAGQICMSTERIIVHATIADEFTSLISQKVRDMYGSVTDTPVLVSEESKTRNRALIDDAVSQGAICVDWSRGMDTIESEHEGQPTRMRPVIISGLKSSMNLYAGESFGPSVSLYTFETEDEMIQLVNDTDYGLAASVFSEDLRGAFRIADRIESGAVHINSMTVHDEFALPHGGVKKSGFGRFNGAQGLDEFLYSKSITWME